MINVYSLYGLAYDYPYFDRQDDCPLKEMEQLPLREKVNWDLRKVLALNP